MSTRTADIDHLGLDITAIVRDLLWTLPRPEKALNAWSELVRLGGRVVGIDALRSQELVRATTGEEYPARNVWRRAGLEKVMAERLAWIDEVLRMESPSDAAMMYRDLTVYFVEGTRPVTPDPEARRK